MLLIKEADVIREFFVDPAYLTDVPVETHWGVYDHIPPSELTPQQVMEILQGLDRRTSISRYDHPEFDRLRRELGSQGYIEIQLAWCNGDRVLKRFRLNGYLFNKNDQFPCGAAMQLHLKYKKQSLKKGGRSEVDKT